MQNETLIRVRSDSIPGSVAGFIAYQLRTLGAATLQAIGANAINQAVKSIAVANYYMSSEQRSIVTTPEMVYVNDTDGIQITAVKFNIKFQKEA